MDAITINGDVWRVVRVPAGDPRLIDRTGTERLATTSPATMTISVLDSVAPPLLDRVILHEVAHAVTLSYGLLPKLRHATAKGDIIEVEEWSAQLLETHAIESVMLASNVLGRAVCVNDLCSCMEAV